MVRCLFCTIEPNYKKFTHYPFIVTPGHLNNYYGRRIDGFNKYLTTKDDPPEYLCLRAIILSKASFDIYWTYLSMKVVITSSRYHLKWSCELLCDIQVKGGSYAKLGDRDLHWDEGIERWILPDITKENPLFCVDNYLFLQTDGNYIWCLGGVFAEPSLRMGYYRSADAVIPTYL